MEIRWNNPGEFNLIPPEEVKREELKRIKTSVLISVATLALLIAIVLSRFPPPEELMKHSPSPAPPSLYLTNSEWLVLKNRTLFSEFLSDLADAAAGNATLSSFNWSGDSRKITLFGQGYGTDKIGNFTHLFQELAPIKDGKILSFTQDGDIIRFKWEGKLK